MAEGYGRSGLIQAVPSAASEARQSRGAKMYAAAQDAATLVNAPPQLVGYVRGQFEIFRNHRNTTAGWSERMLASLRTFNGEYDANKLQEIRKFAGSEIFARLSAQKCRAASSLLRDVYLGADRPWSLDPPDDPTIPDDVASNIDTLIKQEAAQVQQTLGKPPAPSDLRSRRMALMESARDAAKRKAFEQARIADDKIETILREGGFYYALADFMFDLPMFPIACIKGPVVRMIPEVVWAPDGGPPSVVYKPRLTWERPSPFDLWWTPGVADIENADVIEKLRVTRAEINEWLDLPGYNHDEVLAVLDEFGRGGLYDNWDTTDAERAVLEGRENPAWNRSALISMMEFNGNVQGRLLQEYGMELPPGDNAELRDYAMQIWCIGSHVVKAHLSPSPKQRHPYFITSFEKVPGTPVGNSLIDLIADLQEGANACLRAVINNLAISSGPQVVVNVDRLSPEEDAESMYPWKRWRVRFDPSSNNKDKPIDFFQPQNNSDALLGVFQKFVDISDDVSAIPKYIGGQASGGAGRTASGLAMLMGNASKILQTVSANIDRDIVEKALKQLSDLILLTDTSGLLTGEEKISVRGVNVAVQRETQRQRQIEFLSATANPTDMKIVGIKGRGAVLRSVANTIGLDGEEVVPSDDELEKLQKKAEESGQQQALEQRVDQGIQKGVQAAVTRIVTEVTAGLLAQKQQLPEGPPVHLGTPLPGMGGGPTPGGPPGAPPAGVPAPAGGLPVGPPTPQDAARAQGMQPSPLAQGMGMQTNLTGNQRGPGAIPIQAGTE
jgi:hypothetical protein